MSPENKTPSYSTPSASQLIVWDPTSLSKFLLRESICAALSPHSQSFSFWNWLLPLNHLQERNSLVSLGYQQTQCLLHTPSSFHCSVEIGPDVLAMPTQVSSRQRTMSKRRMITGKEQTTCHGYLGMQVFLNCCYFEHVGTFNIQN